MGGSGLARTGTPLYVQMHIGTAEQPVVVTSHASRPRRDQPLSPTIDLERFDNVEEVEVDR